MNITTVRDEYRKAYRDLYAEAFKQDAYMPTLQKFKYIASKLKNEHLEYVIFRSTYVFSEEWANVCKDELTNRNMAKANNKKY